MGLVRISDKELVQRVAGGDCDAFNLLVGRWEKKLFNLAYRLVGNREDAFDICQDTFIRANEQTNQLKDSGKFAQWLFQIARNLCISHYRSSKPASQHWVIGTESEELDLETLLSDGSPVSFRRRPAVSAQRTSVDRRAGSELAPNGAERRCGPEDL